MTHNEWRAIGLATIAIALTACANGTQSSLPHFSAPPALSNPMSTRPVEGPMNVQRACRSLPAIGSARCGALVRTDSFTPDAAAAFVAGYGPADLQSAYALPSTTAGVGKTVAIVDAYDDGHAAADLNAYRSHF